MKYDDIHEGMKAWLLVFDKGNGKLRPVWDFDVLAYPTSTKGSSLEYWFWLSVEVERLGSGRDRVRVISTDGDPDPAMPGWWVPTEEHDLYIPLAGIYQATQDCPSPHRWFFNGKVTEQLNASVDHVKVSLKVTEQTPAKVDYCTCGGTKLKLPHRPWCDLERS